MGVKWEEPPCEGVLVVVTVTGWRPARPVNGSTKSGTWTVCRGFLERAAKLCDSDLRGREARARVQPVDKGDSLYLGPTQQLILQTEKADATESRIGIRMVLALEIQKNLNSSVY